MSAEVGTTTTMEGDRTMRSRCVMVWLDSKPRARATAPAAPKPYFYVVASSVSWYLDQSVDRSRFECARVRTVIARDLSVVHSGSESASGAIHWSASARAAASEKPCGPTAARAPNQWSAICGWSPSLARERHTGKRSVSKPQNCNDVMSSATACVPSKRLRYRQAQDVGRFVCVRTANRARRTTVSRSEYREPGDWVWWASCFVSVPWQGIPGLHQRCLLPTINHIHLNQAMRRVLVVWRVGVWVCAEPTQRFNDLRDELTANPRVRPRIPTLVKRLFYTTRGTQSNESMNQW